MNIRIFTVALAALLSFVATPVAAKSAPPPPPLRQVPPGMRWCRYCNGRGVVRKHWYGGIKRCPECKGAGAIMVAPPPPPPPPPPRHVKPAPPPPKHAKPAPKHAKPAPAPAGKAPPPPGKAPGPGPR